MTSVVCECALHVNIVGLNSLLQVTFNEEKSAKIGLAASLAFLIFSPPSNLLRAGFHVHSMQHLFHLYGMNHV